MADISATSWIPVNTINRHSLLLMELYDQVLFLALLEGRCIENLQFLINKKVISIRIRENNIFLLTFTSLLLNQPICSTFINPLLMRATTIQLALKLRKYHVKQRPILTYRCLVMILGSRWNIVSTWQPHTRLTQWAKRHGLPCFTDK